MSTMQIGELTTYLSDEFKKNTSGEIPWNLIKAMGNHYAHGYSFTNKKEILRQQPRTTLIPLHHSLHHIDTNQMKKARETQNPPTTSDQQKSLWCKPQRARKKTSPPTRPTETQTREEPASFTHKIGKTTYHVNIHF